MTNAPQGDFRVTLKNELEARCKRNPRYSLRSFARDLGLAPSRLSDVIRGRYGLSESAARSVAKRLGWNAQETQKFCDLVESAHARSRADRERAKQRIVATVPAYQQLSLDAFQVIADWYHYAILELTLVKGFKSDLAWIARRLGISPHMVARAIDRLKRLELLEESSRGFRATEAFSASPSGIPSDAIKKFHAQVLEKAISAIQFQSVDERDFSGMTLAFNRKRMKEAKEMIKHFRRDFNSRFEKSREKDSVYYLGVQFFRFDQNTKKEN